MLYFIEICYMPLKCNKKYGRIADFITDSSAIGTDKFVAKESLFCVLGSNKKILMSCRVFNKPLLIIIDDIALLNYLTCFLIFLRMA